MGFRGSRVQIPPSRLLTKWRCYFRRTGCYFRSRASPFVQRGGEARACRIVHRRRLPLAEHLLYDCPAGGDHGSSAASCDGCKSSTTASTGAAAVFACTATVLRRLHLSAPEAIDLFLSIAIAERMNSPVLLQQLNAVRRKIVAAFIEAHQKKLRLLRNRILIGRPASERGPRRCANTG